MTNRSMLCVIMNGLGVYLAIEAFRLLSSLILPFFMADEFLDSFAGSGSWVRMIIFEAIVRIFIAWFLLFKGQAIARVLQPEVETVTGKELGQQPAAISQLWFWIALIGIYKIIAPVSFLIHTFAGPNGAIPYSDLTPLEWVGNNVIGPQLLLLVLSFLLIIFCKPLGRLIQGSQGD